MRIDAYNKIGQMYQVNTKKPVNKQSKAQKSDKIEISDFGQSLAIAKQAFERKTGARGLRSIMEKVMMDVMYQIPSDETIEECVITKGAVEGNSEPLLIHREVMRRAR